MRSEPMPAQEILDAVDDLAAARVRRAGGRQGRSDEDAKRCQGRKKADALHLRDAEGHAGDDEPLLGLHDFTQDVVFLLPVEVEASRGMKRGVFAA